MIESAPYNIDHLQDVSTQMTLTSARIVRAAQNAGEVIKSEEKVSDQSLLTETDRQSEAAAKAVWQEQTNHPILGEETGVSEGEESDGRILGMNDPIDGTRPFVIGAHTSTCMGGAYDTVLRKFVVSSLAHPASGQLIEASNGTSRLSTVRFTENGYEIGDSRNLEAWDGDLKGSTVLVDNFAPFNRKSREDAERMRTITDPEKLVAFLGGLIETGAAPQGYGSNGYHQMLVAKGNERMAGAVMLAQGGVWDALGLPAVENAGGKARAFAVSEDGRTIEEQDPHDPFNWDILVLGNTQKTTDQLSGVVEQMYR